MKRYSIVIPTYNHCDDFLKPCIDSIIEFTDLSNVEIVVSANGCTDNTREYLLNLENDFKSKNLHDTLKVFWSDSALGYAKATNEGIIISSGEYVVLLNNDTVLLPQYKNAWLDILNHPFITNEKCGISTVVSGYSPPAGVVSAIFCCVMIPKRLFNQLGLLNEYYGKGAGEDTEFCIEASRAGYEWIQPIETVVSHELGTNVGSFPIWHKGEGTMHDTSLVPDFSDVILQNSLKLAKKYNLNWFVDTVKGLSTDNLFWLEYSQQNARPEYAACFEDRFKVLNHTLSGREVVDIGAKAGVFSVFAEKNGASRVYSIEPFTHNLQEIKFNTDLAQLSRTITIQGVAGKKSQRQLNYLKSKYYNNAEQIDFEYWKTPEVTLSDVSTLITNDNAVLKIDCDGAEISLLSAATTDDFKKFSQIVVITHPAVNPIPGYIGILESIFTNNNYSLRSIEPLDTTSNIMTWDKNK